MGRKDKITEKVRVVRDQAIRTGRAASGAVGHTRQWFGRHYEKIVGGVDVAALTALLDGMRDGQNTFGKIAGCGWADRAMDATFRSGDCLGPLHRLFDGNHTLVGAAQAVFAEAEQRGLSSWETFKGLLAGLWNDFDSSRGLPLVTLSRDFVDSVVGAFHSVGLTDVNATMISDFFSINATDALTHSLSVVTVVFALNGADQKELRQRLSSLTLAGAVNNHYLAILAFPFLLIQVVRLAQEIQLQGRNVIYSEDVRPFLKGGVTAGAGLGASAAASAAVVATGITALGAPVVVPLVASVVFAALVGGYWNDAERLVSEVAQRVAAGMPVEQAI